MRLDWENNLIFKSGVYEVDKLPIKYKLDVDYEKHGR